MKRVLATTETLDKLFDSATMPYAYVDDQGKTQSCDMPCLRCRACGWRSLTGVRGLPFPHECPEHRSDFHAVTTVSFKG